jgi:hypothetical protein
MFSHRMEAEKAKSEIARDNGKKRGLKIGSAARSADCSANGSADCSIQSQSQSQKKVKSAGAFAPPTLAEVSAYCSERGNLVNPQHWVDHYTANGWKVGKVPMTDWRAAVRTWEGNEINHQGNGKAKPRDSQFMGQSPSSTPCPRSSATVAAGKSSSPRASGWSANVGLARRRRSFASNRLARFQPMRMLRECTTN